MERFWDERARENSFYYVDTDTSPDAPDAARFWRGGGEVIERMMSLLGVELRGDERVIDIGCGVGRLTRALSARARSVDALDVSEEMLAQARAHNPDLDNVRWIHGDGKSLQQLEDGAYDACVSWVVFQHIPDPAITLGYIREIGRVLRVDGWAAFQISNDPRVHQRPTGIRWLWYAMWALAGRNGPTNTNAAWLGSSVSIDQLEHAARQGGLELERVENRGSQYCMVLARRR